MKSIEKYDLQRLKLDLELFKKKYNLSASELLRIYQGKDVLPLDVFTKELSPFETVVKYLRQSKGMKFPEIGKMLGKNPSSCWLAYRNASSKCSKKFIVRFSEHDISLGELRSDKFSLLELITAYLKDEGLKFSEMAKLLKRNERTLWTAYHRKMKK